MPNPNPYKARIAKAEKRISALSEGDIQQARRVLWGVLVDGSERLRSLDPDQHNDYYKLANALTGVIREYRALVESSELEERILALESAHHKWGRA